MTLFIDTITAGNSYSSKETITGDGEREESLSPRTESSELLGKWEELEVERYYCKDIVQTPREIAV